MYRNETLAFAQFYCKALHVKHIHVLADLMGRTQGDMDVVTLKPSWQLNIGMTKNLNNWFFQLQATDVFKTARNSMITYGEQMTLNKWNYSDTQAIRLIVRYSFNATMNKYKGKSVGLLKGIDCN